MPKKLLSFSSLRRKTRSRLMLFYSFSFLLRLLLLLLFICMWLLLSMNRTEVLVRSYGGAALVITVYACAAVLSFLLLLFSSGLRTGTEKLFLSAAAGGAVRLRMLFSECRPGSAGRSLSLECALLFLKALWFISALLPFSGLFFVSRVLKNETDLSLSVYRVLLTGSVLLLLAALFFMRAVSVRCSYARCCLICGAATPKSARLYSAQLSDGQMLSSCLKALPHALMLLPCLLIIPAPFILARVRFSRAAHFKALLYEKSKPEPPPVHDKPVILECKFA